jgi:hypothetical protein
VDAITVALIELGDGQDMNVALDGPNTVNSRIEQLDLSLFEAVYSGTTVDDRRSMLAIQSAVAARLGSFTYLEIGSDLGGSIQPYLLDERCARIISIDKRPEIQPDERGSNVRYPKNSTERMLQNLRGIQGSNVDKIKTFDADSSELNATQLPVRPDLCFIDGEHTNAAAARDYKFCESVIAERGVIYFHDAHIVFQALDGIVEHLKATGRPFVAYNLPTAIFVIDFGQNIHEDSNIAALLAQNHRGYLEGLQSMAQYRQFYNHRVSRLLRWTFPSLKPKSRRYPIASDSR